MSVAFETRKLSKSTTATERKLALATHILRVLYGSSVTSLDHLCEVLGVTEAAPAHEGVRVRTLRREDVRDTVTRLDAEGFVDAMRMRLTLTGFALASSIAERRLLPLHLVK